MDTTGKFVLPSPKFKDSVVSSSCVPHFLSPQGIQLLPKEQQPPPMYGPRGSTVPPKFLSPLKVPTTTDQFDRKQKFYCDSCEAEFHTSTDYKVHKSEHVQCVIGECSFRGHPAFMETHIGQQHAKGLYDQIKKMSTPEEIAQWRLDRQRNYPTVANVEQKWKARQQRIRRGEKLEKNKNRFGKRSDCRPIRGDKKNDHANKTDPKRRRQRNIKTRIQNEQKNSSQQPKEKILDKQVNEEPTCGGLKMFKGIAGMEGFKKAKQTETNVLTSLLGMYGSDSESDTEESSIDSDSECKLEDNDKEAEINTKSEIVNAESLGKQSNGEPQSATAINLKVEADTENKEEQPDYQKFKTDEISECSITPCKEHHSSEEKEPEEETSEKTTHIPDKPQPKAHHVDDMGSEEVAINKSNQIPDKPKPKDQHPNNDKEPEEVAINKNTNTSDKPQPNEHLSSDDEGPEEVAINKSTHIPDKPRPEPPRKKPKRNAPTRKSGLDYRKLNTGRQNTMLEKLLEHDIRHERNVLLQCVRFVVENKFFDKP